MKTKKQIRKEFRDSVFERDNYKCVTCGDKAVDSHHITDRNKMPKGGYVKENGISLCSTCHMKAEEFHRLKGAMWATGFHPDDLYKLINSSYELAVEKSKILEEEFKKLQEINIERTYKNRKGFKSSNIITFSYKRNDEKESNNN